MVFKISMRLFSIAALKHKERAWKLSQVSEGAVKKRNEFSIGGKTEKRASRT